MTITRHSTQIAYAADVTNPLPTATNLRRKVRPASQHMAI